MSSVACPVVDYDETIKKYMTEQADQVKLAKTLKKILSGIVGIFYIFGFVLALLLILFIDVPQAFAGISLQITTISLAVFVAFFVSALTRVKAEIREYHQLLEEYDLRFGELKLRKDISPPEKKDLRDRMERVLSKALSRYEVPEARQVILRTAVLVTSISLIIALVSALAAVFFDYSLLAKVCWVFLFPSILVMVVLVKEGNR